MKTKNKMIECTAWDLLSAPYYDMVNVDSTHAVRIGNGRVLYTGVWKSTQSDNAKLQRLEEVEYGLRKHTRYIEPDTEVTLIPQREWDKYEIC